MSVIQDVIAKVKVKDRYVHVDMLKPGDTITLTLDMPTSTIHRVIGSIPYKLTIRGSNVVDIDPKGIACPLFENQSTGKLIRKTRFIPKTTSIIW